jgi:hypothetical protein
MSIKKLARSLQYLKKNIINHKNLKLNIMTLRILLSAAKKEATLRIWGLAQSNISKIGFDGLGKVQNQLRKTDPNFFGADLFR